MSAARNFHLNDNISVRGGYTLGIAEGYSSTVPPKSDGLNFSRPLELVASDDKRALALSDNERKGKKLTISVPVKSLGTQHSVALIEPPEERERAPYASLQQNVDYKLSVWPAYTSKVTTSKSRTSKAPLALQVEAFIRKEHRQYILDHPGCAKSETLHIFREAFRSLTEHFSEYRSVLTLIHDEYEDALTDVLTEVKRMKVIDLENKSDRSLHAMELAAVKERLNTTISNQRTEIQSAHGLIQALRDQLTAAQNSNAFLQRQLRENIKEHAHALEQVKLLSNSIIEEANRSGALLESSKKKDKDMELLNSCVKVLREEVEELNVALMEQLRIAMEQRIGAGPVALQPRNSNGSKALGKFVKSVEAPTEEKEETTGTAVDPGANEFSLKGITYSEDYVADLLSRLDSLGFEVARLKREKELSKTMTSHINQTKGTQTEGELKNEITGTLINEQSAGGFVTSLSRLSTILGANPSSPVAASPFQSQRMRRTLVLQKKKEEELRRLTMEKEYPIIRGWLREEEISEQSLEEMDVILPCGIWDGMDMSCLALSEPVKNMHLTLSSVHQLLDKIWSERESKPSYNRLQLFFLQWLEKETGNAENAKELGANIIAICRVNFTDPDCYLFVHALKNFLPEEIALTWRKGLRHLARHCEQTALFENEEHVVSVKGLFECVRSFFPEKPLEHMLQLQFCMHRETGGAESVPWKDVLDESSNFVRLLKKQFTQEVERFTLLVIEQLRKEAIPSKETHIEVRKVFEVLKKSDPYLPDHTVRRLTADGCLKTIRDVAVADEKQIAALSTVTTRFRSVVLLRRASAVSNEASQDLESP